MNAPKEVRFPELTSTQINVALVADKLNEVCRFLQEKYPDPPPPNAFAAPAAGQRLKEGAKMTKNGKYLLNGKFVKEEEAYA